MNPISMNVVIGGKRYVTDESTLIANDAYWDGNNWERKGRNTFLFKTKKGNYFLQTQTRWQGERDTLEPLALSEAIHWFETLPEKVDFSEAFPEVEIEEA